MTTEKALFDNIEFHSLIKCLKGLAPRILAIRKSFLLALFDWLGLTNVAR